MTDIVLSISQPVHGAAYSAPVALIGSASTANGSTAGLYFRWFTSLHQPQGGIDPAVQPEVNILDLSATCLTGTVTALAEFGSHSVLLAATDQQHLDIDSIKAVKRSALAGGAPLPTPVPPAVAPAAPPPCVAHQVAGAVIRTPASDGLTLSKANATVEVLAPGVWLKPAPLPDPPPVPPPATVWVANDDYQAMNGVGLRLTLAPVASPTPANSAEIPLTLAGLEPFRAADLVAPHDDKSWLRWTGALPANLGLGAHVLSLIASAGSGAAAAVATVTRHIVLVA